jgi:hypothetical protein
MKTTHILIIIAILALLLAGALFIQYNKIIFNQHKKVALNNNPEETKADADWIKLPQLYGPVTSSIISDKMGNIYAGGSNGIFISSDHGTTWKSLYVQKVYKIKTISFNLIAASSDEGIIVSTNAGYSWKNIGGGNANFYIVSINDVVFIAQERNLFVSNDDGVNWQLFLNTEKYIGGQYLDHSIQIKQPKPERSSTFENADDFYKNFDITWDKTVDSENTFNIISAYTINDIPFFNTQKVEITTDDHGKTWRVIRSNNSMSMNVSINYKSVKLRLSHDSLMKSIDGQKTWMETGLRGSIQQITFDSSGTLYAAQQIDGNYPFKSQVAISVSSDYGTTWFSKSSGMEGDYVYDMITGSDGYVYVTTNYGIIRSKKSSLAGSNNNIIFGCNGNRN